MGPLFVVFNLPPVGDLPDLIQSPEEIEIKHRSGFGKLDQ